MFNENVQCSANGPDKFSVLDILHKVTLVIFVLNVSTALAFLLLDRTIPKVLKYDDDDGPVGSGKLFNMPPVLRHNISAQLGPSNRTQ